MGITYKEFNEALLDFGKNCNYKPEYASIYNYLESYGYLKIDVHTPGPYPAIGLTISGIKHFNSLVSKDQNLLETQLLCPEKEIEEAILKIKHKTLYKSQYLHQYDCLKELGYIIIAGDVKNLPADKSLYPQIILTLLGVKKYNSLVSEDEELMEIQLLPTIHFNRQKITLPNMGSAN